MTKQVSPKNYEPIDKTQKILALQDELLDLRKDMSRKQAMWQKQRSNLLSKNQIATMENLQLKQRILNLSKINDTLSNALSNPNETSNQNQPQNKSKRIIIGSEQNQEDEGDMSSRKNRQIVDVKRLLKVVQEKDLEIKNLSRIGNQLRSKLEERSSISSRLEETMFILKGKVEKKDQQILKLHRIIQELEQKLQQNSQYIHQKRWQTNSRSSNKIIDLDELAQQNRCSKKYIKNSSYLMMKPTLNQSEYQSDSNDSYIHQIDMIDPDEQEQQERLLCEVCSKVFAFGDFEQHVQFCGFKANENTRLLFERKKDIESRLQKIRVEEEKQNRRVHRYEGKSDYSRQVNRIKDMNQIRQIAKAYPAKRSKKNSCTANNYYY